MTDPGGRRVKGGWRALFRQVLSVLLVTFAIDVVVETANPFGMVDVVKAKAADTLQLLAAPTATTEGQNHVTVVLINKHYFDVARPGSRQPLWPMPVNLLTLGVIGPILDSHPKALFVDIGFGDAPREIEDGGSNSRAGAATALAKGLAGLDQGIPIFLGDALSPPHDLEGEGDRCGIDFLPSERIRESSALADPLVAALFDKRTSNGIEVVDASWPGSSSVYHLAPSLTGESRSCTDLLRVHQGYVASPALALFGALTEGCADRRVAPCDNTKVRELAQTLHYGERSKIGPTGLRTYRLDPPASGKLALRWGTTLSDDAGRYYQGSRNADDCEEQFAHSRWWALKNYLIAVLGPIQRRLGQPTQRRCPYIDTISAADLVGARPAGAADPARFLTGRAVLLGVDLPQSSDRFHSPVNGEVPGVYLHAVALENLLTAGTRYDSAEPAWQSRLIAIGIAVLLALAMTALWQWLCRRMSRRWGGWGMHLLAPLTYVVVMFAVGGLLILGLPQGWPLEEAALPLIVLHFILFAGMVENWHRGLLRVLGGEPDATAVAGAAGAAREAVAPPAAPAAGTTPSPSRTSGAAANPPPPPPAATPPAGD